MQELFNNLSAYANDNQMVINGEKSKLMLFNKGRNYDFLPDIKTESGEMLEVVEELKLLGLVMRSDLSWHSNTEHLARKPTTGYGYSETWVLIVPNS